MIDDEELTENQKEERRFEAEKQAGYYESPTDSAEQSEVLRKGGMAIGAIYFLVGSIVTFIIAGYMTALPAVNVGFTCDIHNKLTGNPKVQAKMFEALMEKAKGVSAAKVTKKPGSSNK